MPLKIILTGPESSGKTTLAHDLASALETNLTPEFSRAFLKSLGRQYVYNDLKIIHAGQKAWEEWYAQNAQKSVVVCDTDWTVMRIWEQYLYGTTTITEAEMPAKNAYYFLCAPDMPWQPDALREHPAEREVLFALYDQLLQETGALYSVLQGNATQRLKTALAIIQKLY